MNEILWGWPVEATCLEGFSPRESPVHQAVPKLLNACDWIVPFGTQVFSMTNGKVTYVKQDSKDFIDGGNDLRDGRQSKDSDFYWKGNRIEIAVNNEETEFAAYEHLAHEMVFVNKGDKVKKGQLIAIVGYTGLMAHLGPHLHTERFHWFGSGEEDYTTLQIHWEKENILYIPSPEGYLWDRKKWEEIRDSREIKRGAA